MYNQIYKVIFDQFQLYNIHNSDTQKQLIKRALDLIALHCNKQIEHADHGFIDSIEVAKIAIELQLDTTCIVAALLHNIANTKSVSIIYIQEHFGKDVANLVQGVCSLSKIEYSPDNINQAESFRKLLLAMSDDIKILLLKLAERLYSMRCISRIQSVSEKIRITLETIEIYAPLAERIGAQKIKLELQDLCFEILNPEVRKSIIARLNRIAGYGENFIKSATTEIQNILDKHQVKAEVSGRRKSPFSIWIKMQQKQIGLDQISDITAFRIIVDNIEDCYRSLGVIHTTYRMVPDNFQDFISNPKNNGYQSLHTVVIGCLQQKLEVQIRTKEMHNIAELGIAAHWKYKQQGENTAYTNQSKWIEELLGILKQSNNSEDFLQNTKLAMYYNKIFCFTPHGNMISLPVGSTPVDFAYAVNLSLGDACTGVKINGQNQALNYILKSGDQVEIITDYTRLPSPSASWEKFVVTGKARAAIKNFIHNKQRQEYIRSGKNIFNHILNITNTPNTETQIQKISNIFQKQEDDDFFYDIGIGIITKEEIIQVISPKKKTVRNTLKKINLFKHTNKDEIPITDLTPGIGMYLAKCCNPSSKDKILGIMKTGKGIEVHKSDCAEIQKFLHINNSILRLNWGEPKEINTFVCQINIVFIERTDSIAVIIETISKTNGNIINIKFLSRNSGFVKITIDIEVNNLDHMAYIISKLQALNEVTKVERIVL